MDSFYNSMLVSWKLCYNEVWFIYFTPLLIKVLSLGRSALCFEILRG